VNFQIIAETGYRRSLKTACKVSFSGSVYEDESRNSEFSLWVS
jgi:hypothetical protein